MNISNMKNQAALVDYPKEKYIEDEVEVSEVFALTIKKRGKYKLESSWIQPQCLQMADKCLSPVSM